MRGGAIAIVWATLVAGALDISAAILNAQMHSIAANRVLQSVASGLLGKAAYAGGAGTAVLGLVLHFALMAVIATAFYLASQRLPVLTTMHWSWIGLAFGIVVYLTMSFVIVPLSQFPGKLVPNLTAFMTGVTIHMICVGLPIAYFTSKHSQ